MAPDPNDVEDMVERLLTGLTEGRLRLPDAMLQDQATLAAVAGLAQDRLRAGGVDAEHPIVRMMTGLAYDRGVQDRFLHNPQLVLEDFDLAPSDEAAGDPSPATS